MGERPDWVERAHRARGKSVPPEPLATEPPAEEQPEPTPEQEPTPELDKTPESEESQEATGATETAQEDEEASEPPVKPAGRSGVAKSTTRKAKN